MVALDVPFYGEVRAMVRYEGLPNFCFNCGLIDVLQWSYEQSFVRNCPHINDEITAIMRQNFPYEAWLTGPSDQGVLIQTIVTTSSTDYGGRKMIGALGLVWSVLVSRAMEG